MLRKNMPRAKETKRTAAAARQAAYDKLTVAEKIAALGDLPARKQRERLAAKLVAETTVIKQKSKKDKVAAA